MNASVGNSVSNSQTGSGSTSVAAGTEMTKSAWTTCVRTSTLRRLQRSTSGPTRNWKALGNCRRTPATPV
ncbi:hypothetical protein BRC81_13620 [Halobacteriales archaeon QS_1_68_20]|nr:MAG: hypothetical protein BRC81_13620 [Halobacteriales archaeon QS_1_68_20]